MKLLTDLQAACEAALEKSQAEGHAEAVRSIAEALAMPLDEVEHGLRTLEAQPAAIREILMRRIAEGWLEAQRKASDLTRKPSKTPGDRNERP